ncbi:DUF58 domain-containing protein [Acaryochloris sp. IP29b_bin.137]|uniref:DUF58 domain-containing protein n=1 Tax=Acaryochloris sp. IP29b_bin.137 TaxID=2969217 RepID=UPI00262895F2|nr:DUF58 domain-containing protein [Acaryochloris sp. IP29b_bin.137]
MHLANKLTSWLETHWATPAYAGWVILGLTTFFLLAASNTLAGWLYVLGGLGLALLLISAVLPIQSLQGVEVERLPLLPVSVGESLNLGLKVSNPTKTVKSLLQVYDHPPQKLGVLSSHSIADIPPQAAHTWTYTLHPQQRGVYRWHNIQLRSAAPLGLFWCRRSRPVKAKAIVYPQILPLQYCPLLDNSGHEQDRQYQAQQIGPHNHNEGVTRSIRPYRWGDPLRLVHWRTSARHNEFRTRELEMFAGGNTLVIALDSSGDWHPDQFEQAVIAAASLYAYGQKHQDQMQLWTAQIGLQTGRQAILETLAQVQAGEVTVAPLPQHSVIWLTSDPDSMSALPSGSGWLLWPHPNGSNQYKNIVSRQGEGVVIHAEQPLAVQLQTPIHATRQYR